LLDEKLSAINEKSKEEQKKVPADLDQFIKEHIADKSDKEIIANNNLDLDEDDLPPPLV
jgi:hypothetical protein